MPYISENTLTFLDLNRRILPPQHMGVNKFSDYPVARKDNVHKSSIAFERKYVNFQGDADTKIETYSVQEYICQP